MAKPKAKVEIIWSPEFAYAIGLLVSDGNLSGDGRHIIFTSKDEELAKHFVSALGIPNQYIGKKARGGEVEKRYFVVQFSDVLFYRFLVEIGLMPNKSKLLTEIIMPTELFSHFLRGLFDGDGTFYAYWDTRWKSSFMYYTAFASASPVFVDWLQNKISSLFDIHGKISRSYNEPTVQLRFAKKSTMKLRDVMYRDAGELYLKRKYLKYFEASATLPPSRIHARVEKLVDSPL